jgi:hypothetical protein
MGESNANVERSGTIKKRFNPLLPSRRKFILFAGSKVYLITYDRFPIFLSLVRRSNVSVNVGNSHLFPLLFDFLMTRCCVYLRSKLSKLLPDVLAEPARFYFWRFLRRLELVSCPIDNMAFVRRRRCSSVTYPFRYAAGQESSGAIPVDHWLSELPGLR